MHYESFSLQRQMRFSPPAERAPGKRDWREIVFEDSETIFLFSIMAALGEIK
jgi:hypothetical protein